MKAVIYTRVSSDEQVDGTSLASQEELCRRYCRERGWEAVHVFKEEGQTAKDLSLNNRRRFLEALEYCRKHRPIDAFVVYRVDRFARNTEDHFAVRRILAAAGTTLYSVTEPIGNKPAEKFIETVLAGAAEYDNAVRKQRCTDGMRARISQGVWPLRPPVGYVCAGHRRRGEKKTVADRPHEHLFPLIRKVLRLYSSGEVTSQVALVRVLETSGFQDYSGRRPTKQLVDRLLGKHLPFYSGRLIDPWSGQSHAGLHEPMITEEEHAQIVARRSGFRRHPPRKVFGRSAEFPLRGLVRCAGCERHMTACVSQGNGGFYGYYYCVTKACELRSRTIKASLLHLRFERYLNTLSGDTALADEAERRLRERWTLSTEATTEQRGLLARIKSLEDRRSRLYDMREDGSYSAIEFKARLTALEAELSGLQSEALRKPLSLADFSLEEIVAAVRWYLANLAILFRDLAPGDQARFERLAFPGGLIVTHTGTFRTSSPWLSNAISDDTNTVQSSQVHFELQNSNRFSNQHVAEYEYFRELIEYHRDYLNRSTLSQDAA